MVAYGQSNVARVMFAKKLREYIKVHGIRVFSIDPGGMVSLHPLLHKSSVNMFSGSHRIAKTLYHRVYRTNRAIKKYRPYVATDL